MAQTWTDPDGHVYAVDEVVTADTLNRYVKDNLKFLFHVQTVRAYNTADIGCTTGVAKLLTFNSDRWDTGNMHSTTSNTDRLTATVAGMYVITAHAAFDARTAGTRWLYIQASNGYILASDKANAVPIASGNHHMSVSTMFYLNVADYVSLYAYQDSGSDLVVKAIDKFSPEFAMTRLGDF